MTTKRKAPAAGNKKPGRPAGAKNRQPDRHVHFPPECRACGKTITAKNSPVRDSRPAGALTLGGRKYLDCQTQISRCPCGQWNQVIVARNPAASP